MLKIISNSSRQFSDRTEAGRMLAAELAQYRERRPVVLGIPRGGIVVARELADALNGELDIVLSRKLRTPGYPELAMGAVSEDGHVFLNRQVVGELGLGEGDIEAEKNLQIAEIRRRNALVRRNYPKIPLKDRLVIVTDDGVATGATFQAALWAARAEGPEMLLAAIPVGSEDSVRRLADDADATICLRVPPMFAAVGQFYRRFLPVEDEDVLAILESRRERMRAP